MLQNTRFFSQLKSLQKLMKLFSNGEKRHELYGQERSKFFKANNLC